MCCSCTPIWGIEGECNSLLASYILILPLKFKYMAAWDALISQVDCICNSQAFSMCKIYSLPGQKQRVPVCAIIFDEDNNTNACIWVSIISVPDKVQSSWLLDPLELPRIPIFQAKLQRKLIKMEIHKRNNIMLPMFNGEKLLGQQSKQRNKHLQYCMCTIPINLYWRQLEGKKKSATIAEMLESKHF